MHWRLVITLAIATAAMAPGYAQAAGMFCEPGQEWSTVDSGTITNDGWSVVNVTKPEGGELKVTWSYEDFDDGPATAGFWFGFEPERVNFGIHLHTNAQEKAVRVQSQSLGHETDPNVSVERTPRVGSYNGSASFRIGPTVADDDLHLVHYAAGQDRDGRTISWTIEAGNCLEIEPDIRTARGTDVAFVTAEDLEGTANVHARLSPSPVVGPDGVTALLGASATREVGGTPFLHIYWYNHAGEIQMEGPGGVTRDDAKCFDWQWYTNCLGWGEWAHPGVLTAGRYTFEATGFSEPSNDPTGPTKGPYITLVPTQLPGLEEGSG